MRLLLTSAGITNARIGEALCGLIGAELADCTLAFIPTASNVEEGDKGWLVEEYVALRSLGFGVFDIVDISALPREVWLPRLEAAQVIAVGGGNTPHLLNEPRRTGADIEIARLLAEGRVYVGSSAGSIVAGIEPIPSLSNDLYREGTAPAMGLTDVVFLPHLDSHDFPRVTAPNIAAQVSGVHDVYAVDDRSALTVVDGQVKAVGEGNVLMFGRNQQS